MGSNKVILILLIISVLTAIARADEDPIFNCFEYYKDGNIDRAEFWAKKAVKEKPENAYSYICHGMVLYKRGYINRALNCFRIAEVKARGLAQLNLVYHWLGILYEEAGDLSQALTYNLFYLEIAKGSGNLEAVGIALNNIASLYERVGDINNAILYYEESLKYPRSSVSVASTYNNLALIYAERDKLDKAEELIEKAIYYAEGSGLDEGIYRLNKGYILWKKGKLGKAQEEINKGLRVIRKYKDRYWEAVAYKYLALVYKDTGAIFLAKRYMKLSRDIAKKVGAYQLYRDADRALRNM